VLSITYVSSAVRLFNRAELVELLESSQKANAENGITGMLLYRGGNIIQVIEGEEAIVTRLYENIKADPRHKDVTLLSKDPLSTRQFPDWSMGFVNIDKMTAQELSGFSMFLEDDFTPEYFIERPTRAYILLLSFRDSMS
jgi:hypothetical protein